MTAIGRPRIRLAYRSVLDRELAARPRVGLRDQYRGELLPCDIGIQEIYCQADALHFRNVFVITASSTWLWPYFTWNPVLHCAELMRSYWFTVYTTPVGSFPLCADLDRWSHFARPGARALYAAHGSRMSIDLIGVSHSIPSKRGKRVELRDIHMHIEEQQRVAILGKSAGGLAELLNIICGAVTPAAATSCSRARFPGRLGKRGFFRPMRRWRQICASSPASMKSMKANT